MPKLMTTTATKSINLNATLHGVMTTVAAFCRGLLTILSNAHSDQLPDRLRYDAGALDINPDCQPLLSRSGSPRQHMDHLRSI